VIESTMAQTILEFLEYASATIMLFAVAVIVVGFATAVSRYTIHFPKMALANNFRNFKIELGHALTLGLEILVVADVIESITVPPTFRSLAVLACLIIARTILSWTLTLEIEGHWPWQSSPKSEVEENLV
jgi:uncharacterized membrane protein